MRPLELELEGFASFRTRATIDFRGLDLFAITGPTGSGKTSLLDAMVYALYGRAPRLNKEINQLVSRGRPAMRARLDFAVGEAIYRVARTSSVAAKSVITKAALERKEGGGFAPVAGKGGEVDREVERLIGLDYDSFIRAVVLPQGEFDLFLKGEPAHITAVLNRLLRTEVFGRVRELAARRAATQEQKARDLELEREQLAFATEEARAERERERERLAVEAAALAAAERDLAELARRAGELALVLADAAQKRSEAARHAASHRAAAEQLAALAGTLDEGKRSLCAIEAALARTAYDETRYVAIERAEGDALRLAELMQVLAAAGDAAKQAAAKIGELEPMIAAAGARATAAAAASTEGERAAGAARATRDKLARRFGTAGRLAAHIETERARLQHAARRAEAEELLARTRATRTELETTLEGARKAQATAAAAAAEAEAELKALQHTHAAHELRAHLVRGEPCPVCTQPVARVPARTAKLAAVAAAEKALARARERVNVCLRDVARLETAGVGEEDKAKRIASDISRLAADEDRATAELERYLGAPPTAGTLEELTRALARSEEHEQTVTTAETAARERVAAATAAGREHDRLVAERDAETRAAAERARHQALAERSAEEIRARLAPLVGGADDLNIDDLITAVGTSLAAARSAKREHDELTTKRAAVMSDIEGAQAMEIATRGALATSEKSRAEADTAAAAATTTAAEHRTALATSARAFALELPVSEDGEAERRAVDARRTAVAAERTQVAAKEALAARELADIEKALARLSEIAREHKQAQRDAGRAAQLARDLQADRFVNYLHEEAVEVLAADANHQLKDFLNVGFSLTSENRRFFIIDHANADERRSVRTLSGGESFTASLALAIAFAERLAAIAAAGGGPAALESLFLDEGFGTLDAEHLDAVANAIEALYGRGRTVGIITHIPELAQRMPARIVVAKRGNSSCVTIESG